MWIALSLVSALLESFSSLFRKQATIGRRDFRLIPILTIGFALPLTTYLAFSAFRASTVEYTSTVVWALALSIALNVVAIWIRYKALKIGDLSELDPLGMVLPALLLFTSWVLLGERPSAYGAVGVVLIVMGALYLSAALHGINIVKSFSTLWSKPASRLMLLVVALWSVTANLDKVVVRTLPVYVYVWLLHIGILAGLLIMHRPSPKELTMLARAKGLVILGTGVCMTLALVLQVSAVKQAYVSYVMAVRSLDVLVTVFLGMYVLKEKDFARRFTGATIMLIGVVIVGLTSH